MLCIAIRPNLELKTLPIYSTPLDIAVLDFAGDEEKRFNDIWHLNVVAFRRLVDFRVELLFRSAVKVIKLCFAVTDDAAE